MHAASPAARGSLTAGEEVIRAEEAEHVPVVLAAVAVVRLEVEHHMLPQPLRRLALRPVAAAGGNSVEEAVGRVRVCDRRVARRLQPSVPLALADTLRRSVALQASVIRTIPRERRGMLRKPPYVRQRASVRLQASVPRQVSTRDRRLVRDRRVARRLELGLPLAGGG